MVLKKNMRIVVVDQKSPHIDREGSIKGMPDHLGLYRVRFAKIKADANFFPLAMLPVDLELQAETWEKVRWPRWRRPLLLPCCCADNLAHRPVPTRKSLMPRKRRETPPSWRTIWSRSTTGG